MHNHDTNETFMPITGRWRCAWNEGPEYEFVDVGPCDVVSFPPGVARRFMNVTEGEPDTEHLLLFVVAGNGPQAEFRRTRARSCAAAVTACPRRPSRVRATDLAAASTCLHEIRFRYADLSASAISNGGCCTARRMSADIAESGRT